MAATNLDDDTSPSPSPSPSPSLRKLRPHPFTSPRHHRNSPATLREDCWSEDSTRTLIEAWGSHHLALNRGNLRQHHWLQVSTAVNAAADGYRRLRTDVQCKNRIDTLKKKYKIEKSKTVDSSGAYVSPWPFFSRLDFLISGNDSRGDRKLSPETPKPSPLTNFPVAPRSVVHRKRPAVVDESFFRRQFAEVIAAAAEDEVEERERDSSERTGTTSSGGGGTRRRRENGGRFEDGCGMLAEAMMRFSEVYERVEAGKQEKLIELEKQRMQFTKDLEFQRMKFLMDTQLHLAKITRSKRSHDDADSYL